MDPKDIDAARTAWRRQVIAMVLAIAGVTVILLIGPLLDRRADATASSEFVRITLAGLLLLAAASVILATALAIELNRRPPPGALLLVGGVTAAGAIALVAGPAVRLRIGLRARRQNPALAPAIFLLRQAVAGVAVAIILVTFARLLPHAVDPVSIDLRHFSLHPWSATRLALLTGLLACHAAALWACTLILSAALAPWRVAAASGLRLRVLLDLDCPRLCDGARRRTSTVDAADDWSGPLVLGLRHRRDVGGAAGGVVSAYDRRRADSGAVRGVPGAGASLVSVRRLFRGSGAANGHLVAIRGAGTATLGDAAGTVERRAG